MYKSDLISVIITCYNAEQYITDCLKSLQKQTFKNFEAIVVDDGSQDRSLGVMREVVCTDSRFKFILSKHVGFPEAKNIGLQNATGEYIIFLDSDDIVHEKWLECLYTTSKITGADISTCYYDKFKNDMDISARLNSEIKFMPLQEYTDLKMLLIFDKRCYSLMWNKLIHKRLYEDIHFEDQIAMSDVSVMYKIFDRANKVVQVKYPLIQHRVHDESMTYTTQHSKVPEERISYGIFRLNLFKQVCRFIFDYYPLSRYQVQNILHNEIKLAKHYIGTDFDKLVDLSDVEYIFKTNTIPILI